MHHYHITTDHHHALRRENRQSFVHNTRGAEKSLHKVSVLMLCYNNIDQFFSALDHLEKEPQSEVFMITIIQNSDQEEAKETFDERIKKYDNVTVIYPVMNLGSAGGYALGQEYLLHAGYEHIIMLEDDVELYETDTISHTIDSIRDPKEVLFIQPPKNVGGEHSWYVQYACYPASLIEKAGIVDPRYYFRAEDIDWGKRLEHGIKHGDYMKKVLHRNYYHPYLKGVNNSGSWIYFSLRNQLWSYLKYREGFIRICMTLIQYMSFASLIFFRTGKLLIWKCIAKALKDGVGAYKPLEYHSTMIDLLHTYKKVHIEDLGFHVSPLQREMIDGGVNVSNMISKTTLSFADRHHLSEYESDIVVSGGFQPVWGTIMSCMHTIFVIEHMNWDKNIIEGKRLIQGKASRIINLLLFLPCALLGGVITFLFGIWLLGISYSKK